MKPLLNFWNENSVVAIHVRFEFSSIMNMQSTFRRENSRQKKLPSRWNLSKVAKVTLMWKIFLNWKSLESYWRKRFHQIHVCFHPAISWVIHCVHLLWISNDQHETNTFLKRKAALLHDGWSMIKPFPKTLRTQGLTRVAEVVRGHRGRPPKSLDWDENFKPKHTLFCRELRFVGIYALYNASFLAVQDAHF